MSSFSEGQTHQLMEALQEKGFTAGQVTELGQNSNGLLDQVKLVLMGLATVVRSYFKLALDKTFNPSEFIGKDWSVWKGPADGKGLEGDDDSVVESGTVDFEQVALETHLQGIETSLNGEEKMRRARSDKNKAQLGGKAFLALWNDYQTRKAEGKPEESILEKLRKSGKIGNVVYFFGLTLRSPNGYRNVLYLCFDGPEWYWDCYWLVSDWNSGNPSASLASVKN